MKEINTIVVGELNVDIILNRIDRFPEMGKEILAESLDLTLGSSSAIFASNLSSLGSNVAFIGKIGKDGFASTVLDSLQLKKVDTSKVLQSETLNTGATIVLNFDQDRANVTYPGAMKDLKFDDLDWEFIKKANHLHFSSIFLQPGIRSDLPKMFRKAKEMGLTTSLDPQWDPAEEWDINLQELLPQLNIFMPNISEFLLITKSSTLKEGIEKVEEYAPDIILIIKDGANGAFAWKENNLIHQPAFLNENVVDCIGAGDSFNAGFIHKFTQGCLLTECLKYGALTGAVSTTRAGGTGAFSNLEAIQNIAVEHFSILI
ncbi:carbohydrate kinase family protein [uncultured Sunxiuqinia sp.]|uniref:carbohydrate kinase family protein n=1 Tax=uncultured Sunxiuqinia sp. TaxID=1573825 RepID=UPI002AA7AC52|nr:carbohydrate kinase family protein [uncultured Sunxiuqinia sp.]